MKYNITSPLSVCLVVDISFKISFNYNSNQLSCYLKASTVIEWSVCDFLNIISFTCKAVAVYYQHGVLCPCYHSVAVVVTVVGGQVYSPAVSCRRSCCGCMGGGRGGGSGPGGRHRGSGQGCPNMENYHPPVNTVNKNRYIQSDTKCIYEIVTKKNIQICSSETFVA